ncbi:MAG TPA: outer membrane protein transport protein [Myxococcaceae bacterium]|nr:outer membrane protein transport protein [Myxococcaceae bacterium]
MKKLMFAVMGLAAVAGGSARAAGIAVDLQSARGVGMAGSLIGAVDDASGIYFNPAGIAQGQGLEFVIGAAPIIPQFTVTNPAGTKLDGVTNLITPAHLYATWGISDEWTVGLGVMTPYGLKVEWPEGWEGREIVKKADLKIYDINPTVAYRYGPFRIGGGIQIVRATVELTKDINLGSNTFVGVDLGAGSWGIGGNVGIQYEAVEKVLTLGATYRSTVNLNFDGNAHFSDVPPSYAGTFKDQAAHTQLKLPHNIGFGVAVRPIPELVLDVDLNYFTWQQVQAIDIKFDDPQLNTYEAKNWAHSWNYRIGAEYTLNEHVQLRVGILYDKTPSPTYTLLPDIPDTDRINIGIGGTYRFGAFRFELAYQFIKFLGDTSTYPNPKYQYEYGATAHVVALTFGFKI